MSRPPCPSSRRPSSSQQVRLGVPYRRQRPMSRPMSPASHHAGGQVQRAAPVLELSTIASSLHNINPCPPFPAAKPKPRMSLLPVVKARPTNPPRIATVAADAKAATGSDVVHVAMARRESLARVWEWGGDTACDSPPLTHSPPPPPQSPHPLDRSASPATPGRVPHARRQRVLRALRGRQQLRAVRAHPANNAGPVDVARARARGHRCVVAPAAQRPLMGVG